MCKTRMPLSPSCLLCLLMLYSQHACNSLDTDQLTDKDIKLLSMYMLLFVDDIVLFTIDHVSLQAHRTPCMNIELSGV